LKDGKQSGFLILDEKRERMKMKSENPFFILRKV